MFCFKKFAKFFILFSLVVVSLYTGTWIYAAHKIKQTLLKEPNISYTKLNVTGFPFKIKIKFHDAQINNHDEKLNLSTSLFFKILKLESNILFHSLKISSLNQLSYDITYQGQTTKLLDIVNGQHYLKLTDANDNNTFQVFKSLLKGKIYQGFYLKELDYKAQDVKTFDRNTNTQILQNNYDIKLKRKNKEEKTEIEIAKNVNINVVGDRALAPILNKTPFKTFSINSDIKITSRSEGQESSLPLIYVKTLDLKLDETEFNINGSNKENKSGKNNFKFNLTAINLNKLFEQLVKEQILSIENHQILINVLKEITNKDFPQEKIEFTIQNDKLGIKLGNSYVYNLLYHFVKAKVK